MTRAVDILKDKLHEEGIPIQHAHELAVELSRNMKPGSKQEVLNGRSTLLVKRSTKGLFEVSKKK